jgi:hypothetical protein
MLWSWILRSRIENSSQLKTRKWWQQTFRHDSANEQSQKRQKAKFAIHNSIDDPEYLKLYEAEPLLWCLSASMSVKTGLSFALDMSKNFDHAF